MKNIKNKGVGLAKSEKFSYRNFALVVFGIILIGFFVYGVFFFETKLSGKAILDLDASYVDGEPLDGILRFSMKAGELVPSSSVVVFEGSGKRYEYVLEDVVSDEATAGNFYIEGKSVYGEGQGYGAEGAREIYPVVSFSLNVYKEETTGGEEEVELIVNETPVESVEEVVVEEPLITGQVSLELESSVDGQVSAGETFVYNLQEGETAQIKEGSVKVGSVELSDDVLDLEISGTEVRVSTDYSEEESGFGQEFSGEEEKVLEINLSSLDLIFEEGELRVSLVYGEEEIIFLTSFLEEGDVGNESSEILEEVIVEENITEINISVEVLELTQEQKGVLVQEFGNVSVETTRSELVDGRLIIRYELGKYWVEYSYDFDDENLASRVEEERASWLIDLADELMKEEGVPEVVEEFSGGYEIYLDSVDNSSVNSSFV